MEFDGCCISIIVINKPIDGADCGGGELVCDAIDGNSQNRFEIADEISKVVGITGGCTTIDDDFKMLAR